MIMRESLIKTDIGRPFCGQSNKLGSNISGCYQVVKGNSGHNFEKEKRKVPAHCVGGRGGAWLVLMLKKKLFILVV
jgi:hypothetical protein